MPDFSSLFVSRIENRSVVYFSYLSLAGGMKDFVRFPGAFIGRIFSLTATE